jgi:hypothetical protein
VEGLLQPNFCSCDWVDWHRETTCVERELAAPWTVGLLRQDL